jgi:U4/U6.U5 small nuclear ribonucleoproteins
MPMGHPHHISPTAPSAQGFDTTQGRHVEDDSVNAGAVKLQSKRQARQYMNRKVRSIRHNCLVRALAGVRAIHGGIFSALHV